jgi:hypothetical protein
VYAVLSILTFLFMNTVGATSHKVSDAYCREGCSSERREGSHPIMPVLLDKCSTPQNCCPELGVDASFILSDSPEKRVFFSSLQLEPFHV